MTPRERVATLAADEVVTMLRETMQADGLPVDEPWVLKHFDRVRAEQCQIWTEGLPDQGVVALNKLTETPTPSVAGATGTGDGKTP